MLWKKEKFRRCISWEWLGGLSSNLELEVPHPEGIHTENFVCFRDASWKWSFLYFVKYTLVCRSPQISWAAWHTVLDGLINSRGMSCGPRKLGQTTHKCIFYRSKENAVATRHSLSRNIQNFLCEFPRGGAPLIQIWAEYTKPFLTYAASKFVLFSSCFSSPFCNAFWNCYNSWTLKWIALKFGALLEHIRTYLQFNFCSNGIKKHGNFTHET